VLSKDAWYKMSVVVLIPVVSETTARKETWKGKVREGPRQGSGSNKQWSAERTDAEASLHIQVGGGSASASAKLNRKKDRHGNRSGWQLTGLCITANRQEHFRQPAQMSAVAQHARRAAQQRTGEHPQVCTSRNGRKPRQVSEEHLALKASRTTSF
jgi:hypothetical protein